MTVRASKVHACKMLLRGKIGQIFGVYSDQFEMEFLILKRNFEIAITQFRLFLDMFLNAHLDVCGYNVWYIIRCTLCFFAGSKYSATYESCKDYFTPIHCKPSNLFFYLQSKT